MEIKKSIYEIFTGFNSLLDTKLEEVLISKDIKQELEISLIFTNFNKKSDFEKVKLLFQGINEFSFYYSKNYNFYNVENYKLLNLDGKIYLSLDPDESVDIRSENDMDFILAETFLVTDPDVVSL